MKIAIVGGGASGLMAGAILSNRGKEVVIFEKNEKCGKKIYITGKGRCNLTNNCDTNEYLQNVVNGSKFMQSAINQFTPKDTIEFFENNGLKLKTERGRRVFPESDKASDVTKTIEKCCSKCYIHLNENVEFIENLDNKFKIKTNKNIYVFDKIILACGGKSYSQTGSTGDGYKFCRLLNIKVNTPYPALVPIKIKNSFCQQLCGLSLKNVSLNAVVDNKKLSFFGEMLFTNDAISGPIALSLSSYIHNSRNVELSIDFKPTLDFQTLEKRLLRDFEQNKNKNIISIMYALLPKRLSNIFLETININSQLKVNMITKEMRNKIIKTLKDFKLSYDGLYPIDCGIVTGGGVDLKEINPKTMECKNIKGLYVIGESLDVDCLTGGYNLQTAFSTAFACANNIE